VNLGELLANAIEQLDAAGVPFMVTGSVASSYHGEPRATRDLDIVIDPKAATLERLVAGLQRAGFYVDRDAARTALGARSQFNAIGPEASKVDFIIRRDRSFSREEFRRRLPAELLGTPGFIVTVEDLVVAKVEWAAASDSERQLRDVRVMLAVNGDRVDRGYVERWISALGLGTTWAMVDEGRGA
jgi:predicted nucleotidyltransferase